MQVESLTGTITITNNYVLSADFLTRGRHFLYQIKCHLQCRLDVDSKALALSDSSPLSVLPSNKMSIASCLLLSMKLFCIVRVADRAASPA